MEVDKFLVVNKNDRALDPFKIWLPKPPSRKNIDGYALRKEDQVFRKAVYPEKLLKLEQTIDDRIRNKSLGSKDAYSRQKVEMEIWDELRANPSEYLDEIKWIKKQLYYLHHGYWCFIYGKATYIPAWHYRYLNFWTIDDKPEVEYRDRDRRFFITAEYLYTTCEDEKGMDRGHRTSLGMIYPKHRRDGATHKCLNVGYDIASKNPDLVAGIQSFDESNAKTHYQKKLLPSFDRMPFFLKPLWQGVRMPLGGLNFLPPPKYAYEKGLGSSILYATTSAARYFDGWKLCFYLGDEEGKTTAEDITHRHEVIRHTVSEAKGAYIYGYILKPSTVEDLEKGGGDKYQRLSNDSYFYDRNTTTGQTKSGLVLYFDASCFGLDKFIDKFGQDVADDPKETDVWRLKHIHRDGDGKLYGARRSLLSDREIFLKSGTHEGMQDYHNEIKKFPLEYKECFGALSGGAGFDTIAVQKHIHDLEIEYESNNIIRRGNFMWRINGELISSSKFISTNLYKIDGITDNATVEWVDDKDGRWNISMFPKYNNERYKKRGRWYPSRANSFTHSADPFKYFKDSEYKQSAKRGNLNKLSKGGMAVFFERDFDIDPVDKNIEDWRSYTFVGDYINRPSNEKIFFEDFIMQFVFFGGMAFPETNLEPLWEYINERGFGGYLLYMMDISGKLKARPGFYSEDKTKQQLFLLMQSYLDLHLQREKHIPILKEVLDIEGLEDMRNRDLFTAATGCLLGSTSRIRKYYDKEEEDVESKPWWHHGDMN
jgi:hypothetical protein